MKFLKQLSISLILIGLVASLFPQPAAALPEAIQSLFNRNILRYNRGCDDLPTTSGSGSPGSVYLIGDSIAEGSGAELRTSLKTDNINALASRRLSEGDSELDGISVLSNDKAKWASVNTIIIELGTNGGITPENIEKTLGIIKQDNSAAKVYWVNIGIDNSKRASPIDADALNTTLQQNEAAGYTTIDWATQVKEHPDYIAADGIGAHPTGAGKQAFADTLANSLGGDDTDAAELANDLGCPCQEGSSGPLVGGDNPEKIWNLLVGAGIGLTPPQAAGVMGNMQAESGFDPGVPERSGGGGFGLIQWTGGRRTALENAAKAKGVDVTDLRFQVEYMVEESKGRGQRDNQSLNEWEGLTQQPDVRSATTYWHYNSERSADTPGKIENRVEFANHWLTQFGSNTGGGGGAISGGGCAGPGDGSCAPGTTSLGEADGYDNGQLAKITICAVSNLPSTASESRPGEQHYIEGADGLAIVNAEISGKVFELAQAAAAAGVNPKAGSTFRSMAHQQQLYDCWKASDPSCAEAAAPGTSNHQMGLAIDFSIQKCPAQVGGKCADPGSPLWNWLNTNAANYGLSQLPSEAWHWSTTGN